MTVELTNVLLASASIPSGCLFMYWVLTHVSIQLPAYHLEDPRRWPKVFGSCTCVGNLEVDPETWIQMLQPFGE